MKLFLLFKSIFFLVVMETGLPPSAASLYCIEVFLPQAQCKQQLMGVTRYLQTNDTWNLLQSHVCVQGEQGNYRPLQHCKRGIEMVQRTQLVHDGFEAQTLTCLHRLLSC